MGRRGKRIYEMPRNSTSHNELALARASKCPLHQGCRKMYLGGWGALGAPFSTPPPPGGGLQRPALFFPCFSCIFNDKTAGTATVCHCHCVPPRGGRGSSYGCQPFQYISAPHPP